MSLTRYIAAIIFGLLSVQVHADDVVAGNPDWVAIESNNGMIIQIPATTERDHDNRCGHVHAI